MNLIAAFQKNEERPIFVNRRSKASEMKISYNSLRSCLECLRKKNLIISSDVSTSCRAGGALVSVPKHVIKKAKETVVSADDLDSTRQKIVSDSAETSQVLVVGSEDLSKTRTTTDSDHILARMLSQLETRLNLSRRFKIGPRDLADAFRKCGLALEKFALSVEHVAFHAGGEAGIGLRNPGRWIIKQLSEGYVHEPANFESWVECQERAMLEDAQKRLQRLQALQIQRFDVDFEEHLLSLSLADKQRRLSNSEEGQFFAEKPNSAIATGQLKRLFAKETDRLHLLEGQRDDNSGASD